MPGDNPKCKTRDVTVTARRRTRDPDVCVSGFCSRVEKPGGNRTVFGDKSGKEMEHQVMDLQRVTAHGCSNSAYHRCHLGPLSRIWDDTLVLQSSGNRGCFLERVKTGCISPLPICLNRGWGIPCSPGKFLHAADLTSYNCCH